MLSSLFGKSETTVTKNNDTINKESIDAMRRNYITEYKYYPVDLVYDSFYTSALAVMVPHPPNDRYFCASDYIIDKQNREDFEIVRPLLENRFRELAADFEKSSLDCVWHSGFIYTRDILRFKLPTDNPKFAGHEYGALTVSYVYEGMKKYFTRPFTTTLVHDAVDHKAIHFQVQFIQTP